jgi:hypothetical protein
MLLCVGWEGPQCQYPKSEAQLKKVIRQLKVLIYGRSHAMNLGHLGGVGADGAAHPDNELEQSAAAGADIW